VEAKDLPRPVMPPFVKTADNSTVIPQPAPA
jgi:hypothetical protein